MKKIILFAFMLFCMCGCSNINNSSLDSIIDEVLNDDKIMYNHVNKGYKFYMPSYLKTEKIDDYNEKIISNDKLYYLYVDLVSYYNKKNNEYILKENIYYSKIININEKKGIINIERQEDRFYLKVVYNYATVETLVEENKIKEALTDAMIITSSIKYNDDIVKKVLEKNEMSSSEEVIDIFNKDKNNTDYLEVDNNGNEIKENIYDPDMIREEDTIWD